MTELCDLAEKYQTDRCPSRKHHHTTLYYEEFKDRRSEVRKVLEIGVGGSPDNLMLNPNYITGAGLYMWRDFFPNAMIYGIDNLPDLMFESERIQTYLADQRSDAQMMEAIDQIGTDLDLVVDDACHRSKYQAQTARLIVPLLKKGALYSIEDVSHPAYVMSLLPDFECLHLRRHKMASKDDRMIWIRT